MGRGEEWKEGKGREGMWWQEARSKDHSDARAAPEANVIVYCHVKVVRAFLGFRVHDEQITRGLRIILRGMRGRKPNEMIGFIPN